MGPYGMWDLGSGGPKMELWVTGMNGALWDLGFGVGWPRNGWGGVWDEWGPMGCGIWGRVAQKWIYGTGMGEYGAQGLMGLYGIWDLGLGGPKVDIWGQG